MSRSSSSSSDSNKSSSDSSSSSSSSESSSDSDDDDRTKKYKTEKRQKKIARRQKRSELEKKKEDKEREQRSRELQQRREYLEMKRKKDAYQRFLMEKHRNPNKEPITTMISQTRNNIIKMIAFKTAKKKSWFNMLPPKPPSPIKIGERQETPSIKEWRQMMGLPDPKPKSKTASKVSKGGRRRRTMKRQRK